MKSDFERIVKNSQPELPAAMRDSILMNAKAEWKEDTVEHQLESCRTLPPTTACRDATLNAARSAWTPETSTLNLKRWILTAAAVVLFSLCAIGYDNHQNTSLQAKIDSNHGPQVPRNHEPSRLADFSDLGVGNALLLGTRPISSIDTPNKQIAWRYLQAEELTK